MPPYRLLRHEGHLVFNAFSDRERFWVSVQAAAQGGGAMYAEIDRQAFESIWSGDRSVRSLDGHLRRDWKPAEEWETDQRHRLREAIDAHSLRADMGPEPLRSVVERGPGGPSAAFG